MQWYLYAACSHSPCSTHTHTHSEKKNTYKHTSVFGRFSSHPTKKNAYTHNLGEQQQILAETHCTHCTLRPANVHNTHFFHYYLWWKPFYQTSMYQSAGLNEIQDVLLRQRHKFSANERNQGMIELPIRKAVALKPREVNALVGNCVRNLTLSNHENNRFTRTLNIRRNYKNEMK